MTDDSAIYHTTETERIKTELQAAGISRAGLHRFTSSYLPRVIHADEHIFAAISGRHKEMEGFFGVVEGMLVATDRRVIFIDHRPGYTTMDEVGYDIIAGVNLSVAGLYASVTLYTRIANYTLSFTKPKAARHFVDYIEEQIVQRDSASLRRLQPAFPLPERNQSLDDFLNSHEVGVLSTVERTGGVAGSVIYYTMLDGIPHFMTKTGTRKASNIRGDQHVALTVFDEANMQTAQLQGVVELVTDGDVKKTVSDAIVKRRQYNSGEHLPPVTKLGGDSYVVYRIVPTQFSHSDYSK